MHLVSIDQIRNAMARIENHVFHTPLLPCAWAQDGTDETRTLKLKPENLQSIGSFKIRGAANAVAALTPEQRARGVVTHSGGNHGQGLALAARHYGVRAVIVVPDVAPAVKVEAMRKLGATVVLVPAADRFRRANELIATHGYTLVPSFDAHEVIAGQGTVGLEIIQDFSDVETVLVPIGGGGLAAGVGTAVKALAPEVRVIGVEPELAAETRESFGRGTLVPWEAERTYRTIADGVRLCPSELTFAHLVARLDDIVAVSEDEIREAMRVLAHRAHLVVEPSGALTTAAYLFHREELPPRRHHVAIVSGGNVDAKAYAQILA
ncbi:threonine/serine dehydratase [Pendulispora rubella]|uniref:Threonine/serine dehydratase n=1 Tax=Pendulispora rubella TaxID=2741070 RepID=A0ABZ2LI97_9BACT